MAEHRITYLNLNPPFLCGARCQCGWTAERSTTWQKIEDQIMKHDVMVQRVRAQLGSKRPSLRSQRDYYRDMANDTDNPAHERELWGKLADELDQRLNDQAPPSGDQETLPFDMKTQERTRSDIS